MENGIIRTSAMREKKKETARARYSAAYPMGRELGEEPYHMGSSGDCSFGFIA